MVDNIEGRRILHLLEHRHHTEDIDSVVEIPCTDILYLHHHCIKPVQLFCGKLDVVGIRSQLRVTRRKYPGKIASLPENVIHVALSVDIPAVLCAETAYLSFHQRLVELFLQRGCPE